jgi:TRAP-type uncharacterized transport system fused permease subunit
MPDSPPTLRARLLPALAAALALVHLWGNSFGHIQDLRFNALHFAGFAFLCFLTHPLIRGGGAWVRGLNAWKVAKGLYVMPLLFAYTPLVSGEWEQALLVFAFALPGLFAFAVALQGFWLVRLGCVQRGLAAASAALLLWPLPWGLHLAGLLPLGLVWWLQSRAMALSITAADRDR